MTAVTHGHVAMLQALSCSSSCSSGGRAGKQFRRLLPQLREMGVGRTTGMVELCTKILQIMLIALED